MDIINEIQRVISLEADTIVNLRKSIGSEYKKAVEMLHKCRGKVILTGIGKSGIIAKKIAATMVSTGTQAVYLHPAEGIHGDLGIVQKNDIIIALGKSGESNELTGILLTIRKIGARVIAITAENNSTLAKNSDIVLYTRIEKEACPFNLAPTNSTTAALVVGDAIAITLMRLSGFKRRDFALYHPGGRIGKRLLLTVRDIMRSGENNPVIGIDDTVKNMLLTITKKMTGAVSVIDGNGKLKGLVTDFDIRKVVEREENIFKKKISDIMKKNPICVNERAKALTALEKMEKRAKPISLLPVVNNSNKVVGIVHIHDIMARGI